MKIFFLWHMHQPDYRKEGLFLMPWVFLHSIKDYYDMPFIASKYSKKVTFNLTPVLIEQINDYIQKGYKTDRYLKALYDFENEKDFIAKIAKTVNENMILSSYQKELISKTSHTQNEFFDMNFLFILSWCGNYLKENSSVVKGLIQKGKNFKKNDLEILYKELFDFIKKILPFYKKLQNEGKIEISTTPYYHPVLPLLLDIENAKKANPSTLLPENPADLRDDALLQIQKSIELYQKIFGVSPKGFWPAEGAVDEESLRLYEKAGIKWTATDEGILKKSGEEDIYKAYRFGNIKTVFRDRTISDAIGFLYKYKKTEEAIRHFKSYIKNKKEIFIILDGENAWEYYPNNGYDFLNALYGIDEEFEFISEAVPLTKLQKLMPGSWINGDFSTWVGDEEKNRAWELLYQTKRDIIHHNIKNTETENHFLRAEGSDWFWWYGSGHYTEYAQEFDALFRYQLQKIYTLSNLPVPQNLLVPIVGAHDMKMFKNEPKDYINPVIDGKVTSFFEWIDAGYIDEKTDSTMDKSKIITAIYWGENREKLFFRLDFKEDFEMKVFFDEMETEPDEYKKDEIAEMAFDKQKFKKRTFEVRFEIYQDKTLKEIVPANCRLIVEFDKDYSKNWFV